MRKKVILVSAIAASIVLVIQLILMPSWKETINEEIDKTFNDEYVGSVIRNYVDTEQHGYRITIIETSDGIKTIKHTRDISGIFEYLQAGDSVWKESGSMEVRVKRADSTRIFIIDITTKW